MSVIDACSAPGGKATLIGEAMDNQGIVFAYDLHKNKQRLIDNNATRLGLTNITTRCHDARKLQEIHDKHSFDRILVDAPCTGLGIIRSKPDVKYNKQQADIDNLNHIQFNILQYI